MFSHSLFIRDHPNSWPQQLLAQLKEVQFLGNYKQVLALIKNRLFGKETNCLESCQISHHLGEIHSTHQEAHRQNHTHSPLKEKAQIPASQ